MTTTATRKERDSMGEFEVPADAYYGANTMRAKVNFPISDLRLPRGFIRAIGLIKQQAALVNRELGLIDEDLAGAIIRAAQDVIDGTLDGEFIVDVFQTGSGTSTNMNANEVIANRAIELLGGVRGSRAPVHPNDHVNLGQSSNDVIPTAIQVAAAVSIREDLIAGLRILEASLRRKSEELWPVIKTGRTHLQDATPIRLGQEFLGYAGQVGRARLRRLVTHSKGYVAQRWVPKPYLEIDGVPLWKDLRVWAYRGEIFHLSGRASRRPDRLDLARPAGWLPTYAAV